MAGLPASSECVFVGPPLLASEPKRGLIGAAGVPIIIAVNKIDVEGSDPNRVLQQLTQHDVLVEAFGGEIPAVPLSARTREGLDDLLENIVLVSEIQDLKANPNREARGAIVEAELTTNRGPVATLLVQRGTLHTGDVIIAGDATGKIRAMFDDHGQTVTEAGPSTPVEISPHITARRG